MAFQAQIIRVSQVYELFSTQSVPKKGYSVNIIKLAN